MSVEKFCVYLQAKIIFIPHAFMEILYRYVNLFWVLWACLVTITQNDSITFHKTSMFICMQKMNFIINPLLTILHFKESCNLIGQQHFGPTGDPKFCQMCCRNINNNISFHFRLSSRKTNVTKFFKKSIKPYFGVILGTFCPNLGTNEFSWKKGLCQLIFKLYSNLI